MVARAGAGQGARHAGERLSRAAALLRQHRALHEGETSKAVSEYLGHADPGFTLRTYTHLMEGSSERTKRAIDAVFLGKPETEDEPDEDEEDGKDPE